MHKTRRIITMAAIMDDTHGTNRPGYDKIALLGLFMLSLLMARLIVVFRSRISFSDPIRLSQTGLSVSMPAGRSWKCDGQWQYRENMFSLSSLFPRGSDRPTAWASCRYMLSSETAAPQMRFEQRASEIDAVVVQTNRTQTDTLMIDWARIDIPELNFGMFFGTSRLPDNRQLDIEVGQIDGEIELTERIFKHIIENLKFEDNRLLKAGTEIIAEIKSRGLDSFLNNQSRQAYFLIKDESNGNIGFTMDVIVDSGIDGSTAGNQPNIRAAGQFYIGGQNSVEHASSFRCSNNLDEFVYKSKTIRRTGGSSAEIVLDGTDVITIREFQTQPVGVGPEEKSYRLGPAMIPDILFDQLLIRMIDSEKDQIIIDIIDDEGRIIPTFLAQIEAEEDMTSDEDAAYIFELELLDGRGFSERIFLNDRKQVYKRLAHQDNLYILERTSAENIAREFPEHAERILRDNRLLR